MATKQTVSKDELEAGVAALERAVEDALSQLKAAEATLHTLEEQQSKAAGRLAIARRATIDFEAHLQAQREALEQAARESAEASLEQAVEARDGVARRLAGAIASVLSGLDELDSAREEVELAASVLEQYMEEEIRVRPEPDVLLKQWDLLCEQVGIETEPDELEDLTKVARERGLAAGTE